jgi:hypothetical protein
MPKQAFTINTRNEMVGNLYGISYTNSVRHSFTNASDNPAEVGIIPFGVAVQAPSAGEERWAVQGQAGTPGDVDAYVLGIALRQHAHEANERPSTDGETGIGPQREMAVVLDGFITVESDVLPVVGTDRVWVDVDTGEFSTTNGGNSVEAINLKWHYSNPNDGVWDRADVISAVVEISSAALYPIAVV